MAIIQSCYDFNDEGTPKLTYLIPKGGTQYYNVYACVCFNDATKEEPEGSEFKLIESKATLGSVVTAEIELTEEERKLLRRKIFTGDNREIKYYIRYEDMSHNKAYEYAIATFSLINYTPIVDITVEDTNATTLALTGDKYTMIAGYSNANWTFTAEARKEAMLQTKYVKCGDKYYFGSSGTINGVKSNTYYLYAYDSRGYEVYDFYVSPYVEYFKPTASFRVAAPLTTNGSLTFELIGKYFDGYFGAQNNTFSVSYTLSENGGTATTTNLGEVSPIVDTEGNYTYTRTITGLNYSSSYEITVTVKDELETITLEPKRISSTPIFDWSKTDFKHYTNVNFAPDTKIYGTTPGGAQVIALEPSDAAGNTCLGYGNYTNGSGNTDIYGDSINLTFNDSLLINGRTYGSNKVLWSGASHMNGSQSITLNEAVSAQPNGIILVFSYYEPSTSLAQDVGWSTHFVPKSMINYNTGGGQCFLMGLNAGFSLIGAKYLYLYDNSITGHSGNTTTGTNSGISFKNNQFVLRYVIGV